MTDGTTSFDAIVGQQFDFYGVCNNEFKLGNTVWEAIEDPCDGYRSYLASIERKESDGIFFPNPVARVTVLACIDRIDGFRLIDRNGHVWLVVGTDEYDDYYPVFVFRYQPLNPEGAREMTEIQDVRQEQEQVLDNAAIVPMVSVVLDAEGEPLVFPFSDMMLDDDDPGTISDDDMLRRVERWLDQPEGSLAGYKVTRPGTGNVVVSRPAVFGIGNRRKRLYCSACRKHTLHEFYKGCWECTMCGRAQLVR